MSSPKALLAVHENHLCTILAGGLAKAGYKVATAADGRQALERARTWRPDLLILDYQLPGLGGPEVCSRVQADPATRGLPVVLLMPAGVRYPRANAGPVQVVARPCGPRQILAAAERLIGAAV